MEKQYIVLQENENVYTTLHFVDAEKIVYKRYKDITPIDKIFLKDEIDFQKNIHHPFFQEILDIKFTKNDAIITKKWFDGIDLLSYLRSHFGEQEKLWSALLHFVRYLAYHDFVHFDLKPEHILINDNDGNVRIKIIDWSQEPGRFTPYWAAPEQFDGISNWKSNLYTIALMFYSLYEPLNRIVSSQKRTTSLKFTTSNKPSFWRMIEHILHPQPKMRPENMDVFLTQLPSTDYKPPFVYPSTVYQNFFDFHGQLRDAFYTNQLPIEFSYYLFRKYVHITPLEIPLWITNQKDSSLDLKMPKVKLRYVPLKEIIENEISEGSTSAMDTLDTSGRKKRSIIFDHNQWIFTEPVKENIESSHKTPQKLIYSLYKKFDKQEYKAGAEIFSYIVDNKEIYSKLDFNNLLWLVKNLRLFLQEKKVEEISTYMLSNFNLNSLQKYEVYQNLLNLYANNKVKSRKIENEIKNLEVRSDSDTFQWIKLRQKVADLYNKKDICKLEKLRLELEGNKEKNYPILADIDNYLIALNIEKGIAKSKRTRNKIFQAMKNLHTYYIREKNPWKQIPLYNRMANLITKQAFPLFTLSLCLSLELNDKVNFYYTIFYLYYFLYNSKSDAKLFKNIFEILKAINREKDLSEYVSIHTKRYLLHYQINEQEEYGSAKKALSSLLESGNKAISYQEVLQYLRINLIDHNQSFEQKYIDYIENNFTEVWTSNSNSLTYHLQYLVLHFPEKFILKFKNILKRAKIDYLNPGKWIAKADFNIQLEYYYQTKNYAKMKEIINQTYWQSLKKFKMAEFFYYKAFVENNKKFKQSYFKKALLLFNKMGLKNRVKEVTIELEKSYTEIEKVSSSIDISLFKDLILKFVQIDNINDLGKEIIKFLKDNFRVDKVIIFLYDKIEDRFVPVDFFSLDIFVEHKAKKYSRSILGKYKNNKDEILILDTLKLSKSRSINALDIKSAACIPLKIKGELIGTLYMDVRRKDYELTQQDLPFLDLFSTLLAVFINLTGSLERWKRQNLIANNEKFYDLVGVSEKSRQLFEEIVMASRNNYPVLITGETGTGKELTARAIYKEGNYKGKFIAVNVASIPEQLFESTLFGYKKGAFTGAIRNNHGLVQQALNGVLFLDEISEISLSTQAKLLRFIEYGEYQPVGGEIFIEKSVRIIASSNRDLEQAIKQKKFREDLFYRLNVNHIKIPALRERKEDIHCLVKHFVLKYYQENALLQNGYFDKNIKITDELIENLMEKSWQGNIRELENYVRNLLIRQKEPYCHDIVLSDKKATKDHFKVSKYNILGLEQLKKEYIGWLDTVFSNKDELQEKLGISRSTYFRLRKS